MAARAVRLLSPLVPLLAAIWMWHPLLGAFFYADDFLHLFDLLTLGVPRFLAQPWGGHLYLVRNAIFLALYDAFGPDPRPWFWSVLLTHLLNVLLLHRLIRRLTGDALLACAAATVWGTCPTLEGALGWYSVYGQVLLTTLVLIVLGDLVRLLHAGSRLSTRTAAGWGLLLAIGGACFGSGLGIAGAFPLVAVVALPAAQRSGRAIAVLVAAGLAILAVYAVVRIGAAALLEPGARALLAPGALLADLPTAIVLGAQLVAFGAYTLPFGFFHLALDPTVTMAIGAAAAATLGLGGWLAADGRTRRALLGLALLPLVAYATVAFGRSTSLEVINVPAAHAATWPRYHYLALALLAIVGAAALGAIMARGRAAAVVLSGTAALWTLVRLGFLATRPPALDLHAGARVETGRVLAAIRAAVAAAPPGGTATIENQPFGPAAVPWLFPGWAGVFLIHFPGETLDGRTVRFRVTDADWRLAQSRGGRIARLVERR
jgi:hypothetical protein